MGAAFFLPDYFSRLISSAGARRHFHTGHSAQNDPLTPSNALRICLWVKDGARVGNHCGEKRSFASIQIRSRFVKIILRSRLRAIEAIAPLDNVEIDLQNTLL